MKADKKLDCFGMLCPLPVIKMKEELDKLKAGEVLEVLATDLGIEKDAQNWCKMTGHEYLGIERTDDELRAYIRKKN